MTIHQQGGSLMGAADLTGTVLWDSGPVLLQFLREEYALEGMRVLELGSGTGFVGIGAAALGARVTLTDHRWGRARARARLRC